MATEKIKFIGEFDTSEIVNGLKKMRDAAAKNGSNDIDLLGIDKALNKIEQLQTKIKASVKQGYSSPQEFKAVVKSYNEILKLSGQVNESFQNIHLSKLDDEIKALKKNISAANAELNKSIKAINSDLGKNLGKNVNKNLLSDIFIQGVKEGKAYEQVQQNIIEELEKQIALAKEKADIDEKAAERVSKAYQEAKARSESITQNGGMTANSFKKIDGGKVNSEEWDYIKTVYQSAISSSTTASAAINKFRTALKQQGIEWKNLGTVTNTVNESYRKITDSVNIAKGQFNEASKTAKKSNTVFLDLENSLNTLIETFGGQQLKEDFNNLISNLQKAAQANIDYENSQPDFKDEAEGYSEMNVMLKEHNQYLEDAKEENEEYRKSIEKIEQGFDRVSDALGRYISIGVATRSVQKIIKETYNDVIKLDKAYASIAMVTSKTVDELWSSYDQYVSIANKLGQSTESAIKASALFYQQGLETADALRLTEETMKLATLAGADFETATQQMTAALRGFHMEMTEGAHVTDVYSELAAHAAADVNGIAYAMSKTASIANSAGMEFETTAAFLTQMIETTQEAPENIGTAMKTIIARFTELKENVAGTADSEFEDLDYNKVDKALKTVGISIKDATGQFRNLDDVFLELSEKWDTLDRNSQRYIATIAAGSRQQSRFIAMMENYDRTLQLVNISQNAAGRANQQFAKYADTVEYRVNKLKNTWEAFRVSLVHENQTFRVLLDLANSALIIFTDLSSNVLSFSASLIAVVSATNLLKKTLKSLKSGATEFGKGYLEAKGEKAQKSPEQQVIDGSKIGEQSLRKGVVEGAKVGADIISMALETGMGTDGIFESARQSLSDAGDDFRQRVADSADNLNSQIKEIEDYTRISFADMSKEQRKMILDTAEKEGMIEINAAEREALIETGSTTGRTANSTLSNIGAFIGKAMPYIQVASIATMAAQAMASKINASKEEKEQQKKEQYDIIINNLKDADNVSMAGYNAEKTNIEQLKQAIESINKLSNQTYLSTNQQQKLTEATELIHNSYPELIKSYDENTGKIVLLTNKVEEEIKVQEEFIEAYKFKTIGEIATSKSNAYGQLYSEWKNTQMAYDLERSSFGDNDKAKTTSAIATTLGMAASTGLVTAGASALVGAATGAAIGSAVPIIGTVIGAAIGAAISYSSIKAASNYAVATDTISETLDKFSQLNANTQQQIYNKINEQQGTNINTLNDLAEFISDDSNKQQDLINITKEILDEVRKEQIISDLKKARASSLAEANPEFSESFISDLTYNKEISDYAERLLDTWSQISPKEKATKDIKELLGSDKGAADILGKIGYEWADKVENALRGAENAYGEYKSWDELTSDKQAALSAIGLEKEWDTAYKGHTESDLQEKISETIINLIIGEKIEKNNELSQEDIDRIKKSKLYPQIQEALNISTLSAMLTQEEIEELYKNLENEIIGYDWGLEGLEKENFLIALMAALEGAGLEKEGPVENQYIDWQDKIEKIKQQLQDMGFEDTIIDTLTGEALFALGTVADNILDSNYSDQIVQSLQSVLLAIPKELDDERTKALWSYITETLTPDNFNVLLYDEYLENLTLLSGNADYARVALNTLYTNWEKYSLLGPITDLETFDTKLDELISKSSTATSNFSSFVEVYKKSLVKGALTTQDIDSLVNTGYIQFFNEDGTLDLLASIKYVTGEIADIDADIARYEKEIEKGNLTELEIQEKQEEILAAKLNKQAAINQITKTTVDIEKDLKEAMEDAESAYNKSLKEREKTLIDIEKARKTLYESYHGTDTYNTSAGSLYNYEILTNKLTNAQELYNIELKETTELLERTAILNAKNNNYRDQLLLNAAEQANINKAISSTEAWLQDYTQYWFKENGVMLLNYEKLNNADMPDLMKDEIARRIQKFNDWNSTNEKLLKEQKELDQARIDEQKDYLSKFTSLLQKGAEILKEKAQEEIEIAKEKYENLKEADDEYLDALEEAINKQRQLRERENEANELSQQEKKLSLMMRDTSGSNQKEVASLQKEITEKRQASLDNLVDDLIEQMKKESEQREEERQALIENTEALLEEVEWTKLMKEEMSHWTSEEDAVAWYYDNADFTGLTDEEIAQLTEEWKTAYQEGSSYLATLSEDYKNYLNLTQSEIDAKAESISTDLIDASNNTTEKVKQDIEDAQTSATNSLDSLLESYQDLNEEIKQQKQDLEDTKAAWDEYKDNIPNNFNIPFLNTSILELLMKTLLNTSKVDTINTTPTASQKYYQQLYDNAKSSDEKSAIVAAASSKKITISTGPGNYYQNASNLSQYPDFSLMYYLTKIKGFTDERANQAIIDYTNHGSHQNYPDTAAVVEAISHKYTNTDGMREETLQIFNGKYGMANQVKKMRGYKKGGLANYTGPAWVDGTPKRPEAFLNAEDTERIGRAAQLFAESPILNSSAASENAVSASIGDTSIEININVENIADDYDVDRLIERVHQDIVETAAPTGTPVILHKK